MPVCNRKKCFVIIDDKKTYEHLDLKSDLVKKYQSINLGKGGDNPPEEVPGSEPPPELS